MEMTRAKKTRVPRKGFEALLSARHLRIARSVSNKIALRRGNVFTDSGHAEEKSADRSGGSSRKSTRFDPQLRRESDATGARGVTAAHLSRPTTAEANAGGAPRFLLGKRMEDERKRSGSAL
jgi:hypothetical protein